MSAEEELLLGVAVVTGAGAGLGQALAKELVACGLHVAGIGRSAASLDATAKLIDCKRFFPVIADVSDYPSVERAFEEIEGLGKPITILINNAAIYERFDFLAEPPQTYMKSVDINLGGTVACAHAAISRMVETGIGRIINVATFADLVPLPASSAYSVSKGAARIFTRALVADMGDRFPDIVINDWIPGALATQMGIADGISPQVAAKWGVGLALMHERSLMGSIFDRDTEIVPPRSLKGRLRDILLLQAQSKPRKVKTA